MLCNLRMDPFERADMKALVTTDGGSITCSCSHQPVLTSANGCRVSMNFRHVKSREVSI